MKTPLLLTAVAASFFLAACSDDKPEPVQETRVVHHSHRSPAQANVPADNSPDNFQAVERPATYSH